MEKESQLQTKTNMLILILLLGGLGIHRLLMGHKNWWLMLITAGGCGIWVLIDLIMLLTGNLKMADGRELE